MPRLLVPSLALVLLLLACAETEEALPPEEAQPQATSSANGAGSSFDQPIPLNQPHVVDGWEVTVFSHESAQSLSFEGLTYGTDPGLTLVAVRVKVRNLSAGQPGDLNSLSFLLADSDRRSFGFQWGDQLQTYVPSLLGYPTTLLLPGGELEGGLIFKASASNSDWRLLAAHDTYFALE